MHLFFLQLFEHNYVIIIVIEECYFYEHILFGRGYVIHLVKHHIHINPMY
jgi:hypothetical protein